jgi:hypothetical protein
MSWCDRRPIQAYRRRTVGAVTTKEAELMRRSRRLSGLFVMALAAAAVFAGGSTAGPRDAGGVGVSTVVSGLLNPRGMTFDLLGNLYVAEGGSGGPAQTFDPLLCPQVPGAGPYTGGFTSRISRIDRFGHRTTLVDNLPSSATSSAVGSFVSGVADVKFLGFDLYALEAGAGCSHGLVGTHNSLLRVNPSPARRARSPT